MALDVTVVQFVTVTCGKCCNSDSEFLVFPSGSCLTQTKTASASGGLVGLDSILFNSAGDVPQLSPQSQITWNAGHGALPLDVLPRELIG
jgi:hypothetical protein